MSERRNYRFIFRLNDDELKLIKNKMELFGIQNMSAYLRKMAIDGYVINLDIPEISELISLLRRASNNINQIAKKVNSTDRIYENEIKEIQNFQEEIWNKTDLILKILSVLE
ncbi:MAG: plasmid mobilization relaxosome protein MobC [Acutalibacteraceae bacterium]|nr:plasmid mobilization relaxosome protein MobC [Acutalibacteraceae bacterium]